MAFSDDNHTQLLTNKTYQQDYVRTNTKSVVDNYPWVDGVQIDLEHFSKKPSDFHPTVLTQIVCNVQTALKNEGLRLHSMDVAPWGTYDNFDMNDLVKCMDFILPMGYCDPQSGGIAGPTIELDVLKNDFLRHIDHRRNPRQKIWTMDAKKIILGLPFFGYNFKCLDPAPA